MKKSRITGILLLALVSCERNEGLHPGDSPPEMKAEGQAPAQTTLDHGQRTDTPGKVGDAAMLIEKKPPVAEPAPGQPGKVISPFNGQLVDVSGEERIRQIGLRSKECPQHASHMALYQPLRQW